MGIHRKSGRYGYWFCNLKRNTITTLDALTGTDAAEPYFLNDSNDTVVITARDANGGYYVYLYDFREQTA